MRKIRLTAILTALICALALCASAAAEKDVAAFADAAEDLLFHTDNVTVEGRAELRLDGTRFKTVEGTCIQDKTNSYMRVKLNTPLQDGTERNSGYSVIGLNGDVLYMEDLTEATLGWQYTFNAPSETILRDTLSTRQIMNTVRFAADALALLPDEQVSVTVNENGKSLKLALGAGTGNGLADLALNALYQHVGNRYFRVGYDTMDWWNDASVDDYLTVKEGLLYAVRNFRLKNTDLTAELDADGQLEFVAGTVTLTLTERNGRERELEIVLDGKVTGRGSSSVDGLVPPEALTVGTVDTVTPDAPPVAVPDMPWDGQRVRVIRWTHLGEAPECFLFDDGTEVRDLMTAYNAMTFGDPVALVTEDTGDVLTFYTEDGGFTTVRFDDHNLVTDGAILGGSDPAGFWSLLYAYRAGRNPADEEVMPMIPLTEDALPEANVTDGKTAVEFAKQVWAMDAVKADLPENGIWTAEELGEGRWQVTCRQSGEDAALTLIFSDSGARIETLENAASGIWEAAEAWYDNPEGGNDCLYAFNSTLSLFGQRASETLAPGSTEKYREGFWKPLSNFYYGHFNGYLEKGDARFADYYCEKMYGNGETRTRYIIQYLPEVRVVFFDTLVPLSEGGNG